MTDQLREALALDDGRHWGALEPIYQAASAYADLLENGMEVTTIGASVGDVLIRVPKPGRYFVVPVEEESP